MNKVKDLNFRDIYHQICYISRNDIIDKLIYIAKDTCSEPFPGADEADGAVTYAYIDSEAGITFELLGLARCEEDGIVCFDGIDDTTFKIRRANVTECDIEILDDAAKEQYRDKIRVIDEGYKCSEGVEKTRNIDLIDGLRHEDFPDDIAALLIADDIDCEMCWVRCTGTSDHFIDGILLNEPNNDFGVHLNDPVHLMIASTKDKQNIMCVIALP